MLNELVNELLSTHFGFELEEVNNKTVREVAHEKMQQYEEINTIERAKMFAKEISENENNKRQAVELADSLVKAVDVLNIHSSIPQMYKRETLRFFNASFPTFDRNTASALGQYIEKYLKELKKVHDNLSELATGSSLADLVFNGAIERSTNKFFKELKKDDFMKEKFKKKLTSYCNAIWVALMHEYGTVHSNNPLADKITNGNRKAKLQVQNFLDEKCRVNKHIKTEADQIYKAYEEWVSIEDYSMLGKSSFLDELFNLVPFAIQEHRDGKTYLSGIKIA